MYVYIYIYIYIRSFSRLNHGVQQVRLPLLVQHGAADFARLRRKENLNS